METLVVRWWVGLVLLLTLGGLAVLTIPALGRWASLVWTWLLYFA